MESKRRREKTPDEKEQMVPNLFDAVDPFDYVTNASVCMGIYTNEKWRMKLSGINVWVPTKMVDGKFYEGTNECPKET